MSVPVIESRYQVRIGGDMNAWKCDDRNQCHIRIVYPTTSEYQIKWMDYTYENEDQLDVHTIHHLMQCDCFNVLSVYIGVTVHTILVDDEAHFKPVCMDNNNLKDHMSEWAHPSTPPVNPIKGPVLIFLKGDLR